MALSSGRLQPYDIVSKNWIEQCTAPFLKELVGARITRFQPIEEAVLEIRFGDAAQKLEPVLAKCPNVQLLEQAARAAKTVPSLQEFQRRYLRPGAW